VKVTKAVILAGGLGTRISEESHLRPKPMITIGGMPILWHIMKIYSHYGINNFIICLGYKGYIIKEYFANYFMHNSNITFNLQTNESTVHDSKSEPWIVSLIDTGEETNTGGRLRRVKKHLENETFCLTYGDGVANINIKKLIEHHFSFNRYATMTTVVPPARFGAVKTLEQSLVTEFKEKPVGESGNVNGGFFVFSPHIFDYISNDEVSLESTPLEKLAQDKQLTAYAHDDFWLPMDTLRDKNKLETLWQSNQAPWKIWN
jgi:glucose-1-phosphate cytidylyltransferase